MQRPQRIRKRVQSSPQQQQQLPSPQENGNHHHHHHHHHQRTLSNMSDLENAGQAALSELLETNDSDASNYGDSAATATIRICGRDLSRFTAGLVIAVCGGIWGGSVLIPMKVCHQDTSGPAYLMSFSLGATLVTIVAWMLRLVFHSLGSSSIGGGTAAGNGQHNQQQQQQQQQQAVQGFSISKGYQSLPSFHFQQMWLPGGTSGLLWSTGNFFSILSVHYLGAGVGFCVVQASMLVGGMWGIFYFGEIRGCVRIAKWFGSALVTISGILLLAYEHGEEAVEAEILRR